MKHKISGLLVLLLITSSVLSACSSAPGGGWCEGGLCIDVELKEPIRANEPVMVTITAKSDYNLPGAQIFLGFSDPDIQVEGERKWVVDLKANTPVQFSTTIRFPPREGNFSVFADLFDPHRGGVVTDSEDVQVTASGVTLNPPPPATYVPELVWPIGVTPTTKTPEPPTPIPLVLTPQFTAEIVEQEVKMPIPDNGEWLTFHLVISSAPPTATVNSVYPKIAVIHPRGQDLVAEIIGPDGATTYTFWDRKKPSPEDFDGGFLLIREEGIKVFNGQTVNGTWTLRLRDEQEGEEGTVVHVGLAVEYISPESHLAPPHTEMERGLPKSQSTAEGHWEVITQQDFERGFPLGGWKVQDLSNDGHIRYWDDDDYKPFLGTWAAWPARGGRDGKDPRPGDDDYFNNMNTRMIYGPFDLSDAVVGEVWFYLWRELEENYDYLAFEVSCDGVAFREIARWSNTIKAWTFQPVYFTNCIGDSSVWVAWRFYSDNSVTKDGPWVDDITIWKYVPGQVTARGSFRFYDRDDNPVPARFTKVYLYDDDGSPGFDSSDDLLAVIVTREDGYFEFPSLRNWDEDGSGFSAYERRLDLLVVWETDVQDSQTSRRRVTNFGGWAYKWQSDVHTNVSDGYADFYGYTIPNGSDWEPAMWIFQDLRRAWEYIYSNTGTDPGPATVRWEKDKNCYPPLFGDRGICSSFTWPYPPINGIFIQHDDRISPDTIIHEVGHQYMYNAMEWWYWSPNNWDDFVQCAILPHQLFEIKTPLCAWTEGWAEFLAVAVNSTLNPNDTCYDWGRGPCGADGRAFQDLEQPTWPAPGDPTPVGDAVEGRVACALYDLFDQVNDGWDRISFRFVPIWNIVRTNPHEWSFAEFWSSWRARGYNQHWAVQAIYQNTIDYDTPPTIANLPDCTVLQNFSRDNAIHLWAYSSDPESRDWELDWQVLRISDNHCQVTIDAQDYVDINPLPGWLGSCDVTIRVSDGIKWDHDTFTVRVVPVVGRTFLPLVMRNYDRGGAMAVPGKTTFTSPLATPDARPQPFESPLPMPEAEPGTFRSPLPTPVGP